MVAPDCNEHLFSFVYYILTQGEYLHLGHSAVMPLDDDQFFAYDGQNCRDSIRLGGHEPRAHWSAAVEAACTCVVPTQVFIVRFYISKTSWNLREIPEVCFWFV